MDKLGKIGLDVEAAKGLYHPDSLEQMQQQVLELTAMVERYDALVIELHGLATHLKTLLHYPKATFKEEYQSEIERVDRRYNLIMPMTPEDALATHDNAIRAEVEEETIDRCSGYICGCGLTNHYNWLSENMARKYKGEG